MTPFRWPDVWTDPAALGLLENSGIDCVLVNSGAEWEPVRVRARRQGLRVGSPGAKVIDGVWPGVRMAGGGEAQTSAGPTGAPWVDSNGWAILLAAALHPESEVWVNAAPQAGGSYRLAIADSAAHGGRWIVALDSELAAGLAGGNSRALAEWAGITAAAKFFAGARSYMPAAVLGVVSDFSGPNEFFSRELLNLLARAGMHYRVMPKSGVTASWFAGLRAVIYADAAPPAPELRREILGFVEAGGLLIAGPEWGSVRSAGKGRIELARTQQEDPYQVANDCAVLVSHRYDLVRFWNGGATGSVYTAAPDGRKAVVHLLFYADRGPDDASVRIAGRFRTARAFTVDGPVRPVNVLPRQDAVEIHLPRVDHYVRLELES